MTRKNAAREGTSSRGRPTISTVPLPIPPAIPRGPLLPLPLGLSRKWMEPWLNEFEVTRCVTTASARVGLDRTTPYEARRTDKVFDKAWREREYAAFDRLQRSAFERAVEGWLEPIYHEGVHVGWKPKFSDRMTELLLRGNLPAIYNRSSGDAGNETNPQDTARDIREALRAMRANSDAEAPAEQPAEETSAA